MAMIQALKGCLMFLGILALIIFVVIAGEVAFMLLIQIIDDLLERRRRMKFLKK